MATLQSLYRRYVKPRLEADPEFRAKYMKQRCEIQARKYHRDEIYRVKQDERVKHAHRVRYAEDPEYRERKKKDALERYYKNKALKSQSS